MVLKEETADVVSFRESASGEQMPRVRGAGTGRGDEWTVRGWWERATLSVAARRVSECDESIDRYARV